MQNKTKKGATSLITTMFFTLLAGILVLSFVSIMLTNINESTNYNLSQSAYDAALAGIEDAKVALLLYNDCISRGDTSSTRCKTVYENLSTLDRYDENGNIIEYNPEDDCDIVRKALGRADGENETPIRTDNTSNDNNDSSFDMAYTCVKLATKVPDYLGQISKDSDMKVIPLRTEASLSGGVSIINRIRIEWFSSDDYSTIIDNGLGGLYAGTEGMSAAFTNNKVRSSSITDAMNKFATTSYLPPSLTVGLIQAQKGFMLSQFTKNDGLQTNRGRITLRAIGGRKDKDSTPRIKNDSTQGFAVSAMAGSEEYRLKFADNYNAENSPMDVKCFTGNAISNHAYACSVEIDLPDAIGGTALDTMRYITLSTPYSNPDISFSVTMLACTNLDDSDSCNSVDFVGVQSKVDSTGRANDLFRRVEARVELTDVGYPYPKYALGVYGNGDGEGNIIKNYNATKNCYNITNGSVRKCGQGDINDYGYEGKPDDGNFGDDSK